MGYWQLFIDESGDFAQHGDSGTVAGVLVRSFDSVATRARLRAALGRVYPRVPYPPHAADLNLAASRIAFDRLADAPADPAGVAVRAQCDPAWQRLCAAGPGPSAASTFVQCVTTRTGRWAPPDRENHRTIRDADAWLQRNAIGHYGALRCLVDQQSLAMVACCHALGETLLGTEAYAVACWARHDIDSLAEASRCRLDGYLVVLATLFERVRALLSLRRDDARHLVLAHVARRSIAVTPGELLPMTTEHLRRALEHAHPPPSTGAPVTFALHPPWRYDTQVHPGLVLADFVANRLHRRLRYFGLATDPWSDLARYAEVSTGLALEVGTHAGLLPSCAAAGDFRTAVLMAWQNRCPRGALLGALAGERPRWAAEQAALWIDRTHPEVLL